VSVHRTSVWITATVLAHTVVIVLHAWAHASLGVDLSRFQVAFIVSVIMVAPILAAALAWTTYRRLGAIILTVAMFGALIFGAYYHFLDSGMDNISEVPSGHWGALIRVTSVLLAITEGGGSIVGWLSIRILRRNGFRS